MAFRRSLLFRQTLSAVLPRSAATALPESARGMQTVALPDLPYDYSALEPAISGEIMMIHHQKHHKTYVANYNKALEQLQAAMASGDSSKVVGLQRDINFNGGGHINHSIFWKNLSPTKERGGEPPKGSLGWMIDEEFGSLQELIMEMRAGGALLQGSGWVWLALDKDTKKIKIETTANQDPLVTKGLHLVPLLGLDVWEHAYYLQYKNDKAEYLKKIWEVVNWNYAGEIYDHEREKSAA